MRERVTRQDKVLGAVLLFAMTFGLGFVNWLLGEGGHF